MFDFLFNGGFMFILIIAGIAVFLNFVPLALWISAMLPASTLVFSI